MDEAAVNKLVEERVAAILAKRETDEAQQEQIKQRQSEDKRLKDQALMRMSGVAQQEPSGAYGTGRQFGHAQQLVAELRRSPQVADMAEEIMTEVYGPNHA